VRYDKEKSDEIPDEVTRCDMREKEQKAPAIEQRTQQGRKMSGLFIQEKCRLFVLPTPGFCVYTCAIYDKQTYRRI